MQQNQAVRERQPFFKPLSNMDKAGSLFNFGGSSDRNPKAVESSQLTQAREKVEHTSNLFKKTDQDQNEGAGRLSSLHAKLHQEADKIRRWKTQTEMELKKKESQVSEAVQTIESLRKSILELQLQNENLSLKLQDEKTNQEEIVRKIDATRNMCNLLKDHTADVEGRLVKCETERTELKYLEKTHTRQFEELSSRFKDLNISFAEEKEKLVEQVAEGKKAQEELKSDLNTKLCEAETQLQQLLHENHIKAARINELQMDLENNQQALDKAITEMDTLKQRYVEVEEEYERQSKLLQDTLDDFRSTKAEKVTLESHCHEVGQALNEATKAKDDLVTEFDAQKLSHENALLSLREEINVANQTLEEEKNRMKDMCLQYEKSQATVEELKSSRDILIKEKSEIQIQLSEMEREKVLLEALHSSDELTMSDLKMELERVVTELAVAKKEVCHRKEEAEVLRQQLGDVQIVKETALGDLSNLRDEMDEKLKLIERLQSDIHTAQESEEQQKKIINELEETLQKQRQQVEEQAEQIQSLKAETQGISRDLCGRIREIAKLEKVVKKHQTSEEECKLKITELIQENEAVRQELEMRREEFDRKLKDLNNLQEKGEESVKEMEQRLALKSKSATDFETKVKSLKTDATVKNKQIKELEKETKSLKSQLDKMTKAQNCLKTNLEEKDSEIKSATANQLDLEKQLEILKKKIEEDKEFVQHSKEQVSKMEQEKKKAMEEKESAAKKCEYEMGEMMSTLEKYKQDNQNILTQKDKEIGVLKSKVAELRKQADDKTEDLRSELDSLKKKLDEEEKEKSVMEKRAAKQEKKMTAVVKQSNSKDDEIQSLKKSLEELKEQLVKEKTVVVTPQQRYPEEPIQNLEALITPRVPKASSLEVLKTAQRSILRQTAGSSVSKKRRVAFSTDLDSHGENSDSSSSELMEVEISEVENRYKDKKKRRNTPIPVRPSPKVSKSPGPDGDCGKESVMMTPLRPVPRGPSINSKKKKTSNLTDEMGQFKKLFPNFVQSDEKQQSKSREPDVSSNVRKTPSKASGKFFKSSPKDRNRFSKLSKLEEKEDLAWFDLDSVFGFGPED